jgi:protein TonB
MPTRHPVVPQPAPDPIAPAVDRSGGAFLIALAIATLIHLAGLMLWAQVPATDDATAGGNGASEDNEIEVLIAGWDDTGTAERESATVELTPDDPAVPSSPEVTPEPPERPDDLALTSPQPAAPAATLALAETPEPIETPDSSDGSPSESDQQPLPEAAPEVNRDPAPAESATPEPEAPPERETEPDPETPPDPAPHPDVESTREPGHEPEALVDLETDVLASPEPVIDAARILASRGAEIARLTSERRADAGVSHGQARRKRISAGTHEFRYASYLSAWTRKVERIGHLNYPQAAREQRMYGNLILEVALRSDGTLERVRVVRSSGYPLLDEAAVRIVELGAPYAPFPPDIAAETDVLDIVRTWQFLQGGRLGWEQ